jgi:hypothetical protein
LAWRHGKSQLAILANPRLDPFERMGMYNGKDNGSIAYYNWFVYQFWRFVFVQREVAQYVQTSIAFPPMQKGASFNMSQVKEQIQKALATHTREQDLTRNRLPANTIE